MQRQRPMVHERHLPNFNAKRRDQKGELQPRSRADRKSDESRQFKFALRRCSARIGAVLLATLAIAPAMVSSPQARSLETIKQSGQLRVTVYRDYKPWSWLEDGKMKGIDVDIGAALAKQLGVKVDYLELRADDDIKDDLRNGVWRGSLLGTQPGDVMLHVPYDKQIETDNDKIKLVAPYHTEGLAMAVEPGKADSARDFALFETEKVAVDVGTLSDIILLSVRDHKLIDRVVHVRGVAKAATAYERGEVSAFYGEAAMVENLAHTVSRPTSIVFPQHWLAREWTIGGAVKVDEIELGEAIDRGVAELKSSGEMQRIFAAYGVNWRNPPQD
jgi:ABC-type amino acid transport substrate-binding protein